MTVGQQQTYKYDQVSRYINQLIEKGDLKPGDKAPSLRKLSKQLGVSIATVTQSYVNLEDQGVLTARPQSADGAGHQRSGRFASTNELVISCV